MPSTRVSGAAFLGRPLPFCGSAFVLVFAFACRVCPRLLSRSYCDGPWISQGFCTASGCVSLWINRANVITMGHHIGLLPGTESKPPPATWKVPADWPQRRVAMQQVVFGDHLHERSDCFDADARQDGRGPKLQNRLSGCAKAQRY
mmetsp:Transcript_18455/g.52128  ORF Transcript_18455/g.52128 Transcript_18455/m.52128 type:complete len:146 (+) Transcript_18455:506-943(+)